VQITLTAPNQCAISPAGFRCFKVVAGVGVQVQETARRTQDPSSSRSPSTCRRRRSPHRASSRCGTVPPS
jgi:hypothetical protein